MAPGTFIEREAITITEVRHAEIHHRGRSRSANFSAAHRDLDTVVDGKAAHDATASEPCVRPSTCVEDTHRSSYPDISCHSGSLLQMAAMYNFLHFRQLMISVGPDCIREPARWPYAQDCGTSTPASGQKTS